MVERGDIKGTSKRMVVDGNVVERISFEKAFTHHVDFVIMCCVDGIPFHSSRKKGMRKYSGRLKPGYVPPSRKTCVRILEALDALCDDEKAVRLQRHVREVGGQCIGMQFDMMTKHGVTYISVNGSIIIVVEGCLQMQPFQFGYNHWPAKLAKDGRAINSFVDSLCVRHGVNYQKDVGSPMIDGGSANWKAMRLGKKDGRYCAAHKMGRKVLYALGMTKTSQPLNPEGPGLVKTFKRWAAFVKKCRQFDNSQKDFQVKLGLAQDFASAKTTVVANETRWDGIHDTIERSTDLEMPMYKAKSALINGNVLDMMDLDDDESSVDADAELPLEEDSLSDASSDSDVRLPTPSREKKWEDRMEERFPEKKAWHGGHGLRTALGAPRAFNKLIQHSTEPTVHLTLKLARGVINASSRTPVTMTKWVTSGESMVLGRERVMAVDLPSVAQTTRTLLAEQVGKGFFEDDICDRDLVALHMDVTTDPRKILKSKPLETRMMKAYQKLYRETERFLGVAPPSLRRGQKKKQQRRSGDDGFDSLMAEVEDPLSSDEENDDEVPATDEMNQIHDIRQRKGDHPDVQRAIVNGKFEILLFYSQGQSLRPVHYNMARQVFADQSTEGVSESSFSTHGMLASKLRKVLGPEIAAMMVKVAKNIEWLGPDVLKKVFAKYKEMFRADPEAFRDEG